MKRFMKMTLVVFVLMLWWQVNAAAVGSHETDMGVSINALLTAEWMPQDVVPVLADSDEGGPFYTVNLASKHTGESVGVILIDHLETNRVLYYCAAGYELPEWPHSDTLWGMLLRQEERTAWQKKEERWAAWAQQAISICYAGQIDRYPQMLHSSDPSVAMFTVCNTSHGDLTAVMVCRISDEADEAPEVLAYVDVRTNPCVGYDGYINAQQAEEKARAYAHVQYGLDVSNRLICDTQDMIVYDYVLYYGESDDSDDMEALENSCSPMWVISFQDPLYDGNNMDNDQDALDQDEQMFAEEYDETWIYTFVIDARTGNLIELIEDTYGNG